MKVTSMGMSLFHVMNLLILNDMMAEVVSARSPDSVVASAYEGIRNGRIVIMNIPKPNPVALCTKLAPTVSRNISMIFSIFLIILCKGSKTDSKDIKLYF